MMKDYARTLLPEVGEVRWEKPTYISREIWNQKPRRCTVVAVHLKHLWYTVRYENGIRETYKVPRMQVEVGGPYGKGGF